MIDSTSTVPHNNPSINTPTPPHKDQPYQLLYSLLNYIRRYLLVFYLVISVAASTLYLIVLKWQWTIEQLFSSSTHLDPSAIAMQLFLIAESGMAVCAGGLLAVVSILLQQVVRNNLASDTTLAVGSGAQLAMVLAIVFFPSWSLFGSFWVAFIGAIVSLGLVMLIALPSRLNPLVLILAGLVISILTNSIVSLVMVFNTMYLPELTIWSSGLLYQVSWQPVQTLAWVCAIAMPILMFIHKPLMLMALDDEQASRLGLPVQWLRIGVFIICALLTAMVVSKVGLIGFVGLGAATMVNAMQVCNIRQRLWVGFLVGGLLLWLTNNLLHIFNHFVELSFSLPAGAFTGLLGAPLIIWLILRQRKGQVAEEAYDIVPKRRKVSWWQFIIVMVYVFIVALIFVKGIPGWHFSLDMGAILQFRLGRTLAAAATGIMLAIAGVLLQQMTRNPMASPEVLGVSSAASISIVMAYLIFPSLSILSLVGSGFVGSGIVLLLILWLANQVHSSYLLLIGIAIGALMTACSVFINLSGDPRLEAVLFWLSGTTYHLNPQTAYILLGVAFIGLIMSFLLVKPLKLLSLSETVAKSLGLSIRLSQVLILILVALLSTVSAVAIGPLSFIGLMAPQLARSLGAVQVEKQLPLAAIIGAIFMMIADWLGRYVLFPYEISAGVISGIVGGAYFLIMMRKFK